MDLLDEEVFAVITAIIVVASVFSAAMIVRPNNPEPFSAIGLLDQNCKIGDYPDFVLIGENVTLCLFVSNHMGKPESFMIVYKFGTPNTLPTNTTPSPAKVIKRYVTILNDNEDNLLREEIPIPYKPEMIGKNATLIFELWQYDTIENQWVYTGKWVHLHVRVEGIPLP